MSSHPATIIREAESEEDEDEDCEEDSEEDSDISSPPVPSSSKKTLSLHKYTRLVRQRVHVLSQTTHFYVLGVVAAISYGFLEGVRSLNVPIHFSCHIFTILFCLQLAVNVRSEQSIVTVSILFVSMMHLLWLGLELLRQLTVCEGACADDWSEFIVVCIIVWGTAAIVCMLFTYAISLYFAIKGRNKAYTQRASANPRYETQPTYRDEEVITMNILDGQREAIEDHLVDAEARMFTGTDRKIRRIAYEEGGAAGATDTLREQYVMSPTTERDSATAYNAPYAVPDIHTSSPSTPSKGCGISVDEM